MKLNKKGELRREFLVLFAVILVFVSFTAVLSLALTPEEEKAQLEAELGELEQTLAVISAGLGQDFGGVGV